MNSPKTRNPSSYRGTPLVDKALADAKSLEHMAEMLRPMEIQLRRSRASYIALHEALTDPNISKFIHLMLKRLPAETEFIPGQHALEGSAAWSSKATELVHSAQYNIHVGNSELGIDKIASLASGILAWFNHLNTVHVQPPEGKRGPFRLPKRSLNRREKEANS